MIPIKYCSVGYSQSVVFVTVVKLSVMERRRYWMRTPQCCFSNVWNCRVLIGYQFECGSISHCGCWAACESVLCHVLVRCLNYHLSLLFSFEVFYFGLFTHIPAFLFMLQTGKMMQFQFSPECFLKRVKSEVRMKQFSQIFCSSACLQFSLPFSIFWSSCEMAYGPKTQCFYSV